MFTLVFETLFQYYLIDNTRCMFRDRAKKNYLTRLCWKGVDKYIFNGIYNTLSSSPGIQTVKTLIKTTYRAIVNNENEPPG